MRYKFLTLQDGSEIKAALPYIISASRNCDLPSEPDKLLKLLSAPFVSKVNPFNRKLSYIAFDEVKLLVLWSKFPRVFLKNPSFFKSLPYKTALLYTLNDYEKEGFEQVPDLYCRIELFKESVRLLGKGAVIWRYDPIILNEELTAKEHVKRFYHIAQKLSGYCDRVIFSFVDTRYPNAKKNAAYLKVIKTSNEEKLMLIKNLVEIGKNFGMTLQSCAQSSDFTVAGAESDGCIGKYLVKYYRLNSSLCRDRAQRKLCLCLESRDIGQEHGCKFNCAYCYAFKEIKWRECC